MAQKPSGNNKLAQEKRDIARRARRLAEAQMEPDKSRLTQFASELDHEAETLEQSAASICLPPVAAPIQQVQQQAQQQQTAAQPILPQEKE